VREQQTHNRVPVAQQRGQIERRSAFDLPDVDRCAARHEHAHLRFIVDGPVERRGAASILRVDVRAEVEQQEEHA
jgi:hypothetical protein